MFSVFLGAIIAVFYESSIFIVLVTFAVADAVCVRRISFDGEGNALYPVLSSLYFSFHFRFSDRANCRVQF